MPTPKFIYFLNKMSEVLIYGRGKNSDELDYFFSFISSNYPEIALGYDGPQA